MCDQNKPSWEDAPEWANYLAMDEDGEWWWFEFEPRLGDDSNGNTMWIISDFNRGLMELAARSNRLVASKTLESRPQND